METTLQFVTLIDENMYFTGVNVHIRNGLNATESTDGTGTPSERVTAGACTDCCDTDHCTLQGICSWVIMRQAQLMDLTLLLWGEKLRAMATLHWQLESIMS